MADQGKLTIEITTGHCLGGEGNDVYPGKVLEAPRDLSIEEARKKVRMGYARVIPNPPQEAGPEAEEASGPVVVTHQDPAVINRDPEVMPQERRRGRTRTGGRKSE